MYCHMKCVICHMSHGMRHISPDNPFMQLQLPRDWSEGGLVVDGSKKKVVFFAKNQHNIFCQFLVREFKEEPLQLEVSMPLS